MQYKIGDRVKIGEAAVAPWARGQAGVIEGFIKRYDGEVYMATVRLDSGREWTAYLGNIEAEKHYPHIDRYLKIEAWLRKRYIWRDERGRKHLTISIGDAASKYTRLEVALAHRYGILG